MWINESIGMSTKKLDFNGANSNNIWGIELSQLLTDPFQVVHVKAVSFSNSLKRLA